MGRTGNLEDAAWRSLRKRPGLDTVFLQQFYTLGNVVCNTHYAIEETLIKQGLAAEDVQKLPGRDVYPLATTPWSIIPV